MLFRDGESLALRPKVAEILTVLVESQGNTVTKEELLQKVWADAQVTVVKPAPGGKSVAVAFTIN
jgi:DNA-binding winged helix-turn-helix (wHTH) protein